MMDNAYTVVKGHHTYWLARDGRSLMRNDCEATVQMIASKLNNEVNLQAQIDEFNKSFSDSSLFGIGFIVGGKRVSPSDVIMIKEDAPKPVPFDNDALINSLFERAGGEV